MQISFSPTVPLALFGFIPFGIGLVMWLGPRRGLIAVFILGWLLLPPAGYRIPAMKSYTKVTAITVTAMLSVLIFDAGRLLTFRPRLTDLPMIVWCAAPIASSLSNDLGIWDGLSVMSDQILVWGVPYLIGRLYFTEMEAIHDLAVGIVLGGLVYLPLCAWEIKMSPQLNQFVYGFSVVDFLEAKRYGAWRPTVFLQHGLAVAFYMCGASVTAIWLWRRRVLPRIGGLSAAWVVPAMAVVAVLCRSGGALALLAVAMIVLFGGRAWRSRLPIMLLLALAPTYMATRGSGVWSGQQLVDASAAIDDERSRSLDTRIKSEDLLAAKARQQVMFGWGGWGRSLAQKDEATQFWAIPDGFWIITFGEHGMVGLAAFAAAMLLPVLEFLRRSPPDELFGPHRAAALCVALLIVMFVIDCLFNAMINPVYSLAAGALAGLTGTRRPTSGAAERVPESTRRTAA